MADVSLSIAFVGGGLATLNPCGFPLLPAFLSFYAGADETQLPSASTRLAQGLAAGLLVTAGFLGVFAVIGLPISLGATAISRVLP
jgi:cytochrome c-type biogenesis protein